MENQELILLIGELKGTMIAIQSTVLDLHKEIKTVSTDLGLLPCVKHTQEIEVLQDWQKACNGVKQIRNIEKMKGGISLRNSLIIGCVTFIFGVVLSIITSLVIK